MSHVDLIQRAQAGDHGAFSELYTSCYAPVYRFIVVRVKSKEDADDITQDVFVKMLRALPTYQSRSDSLLPYLFTIARNAIIDYLRKKKPIYDDDALWDLASADPSPEEAARLGGEVTEVLKALHKLSEAEEAAITLKYLDGLGTAEVAGILGRTEESVRQLLSRGIRNIRSILESTSSKPV